MKFKIKLILGLVLFAAFAAYIYRTSVFRISKNFEVVEDGKLYRSAQLTTEELQETVRKYNIKTVMSLRGSPGRTDYYEPEADTVAGLKIKFVPIPMSDRYYPLESEVKEVFSVFEDPSNYPVLIHCRVGTDRTGMVAALYERVYMNKSVDEALKQLTFDNWHVRYLRPAMSSFVRKFKDLKWVLNDYKLCSPEFSEYREPGYDCKK
ncbi:MAG: tyrosine-protein phosphatase [Bdellovibrio sp.]|nr:tyrosine-protein phosphatase [Bdellovibrio sp.]